MSAIVLRSITGLRHVTAGHSARLPPIFLLPTPAVRFLHQTTQIIEPARPDANPTLGQGRTLAQAPPRQVIKVATSSPSRCTSPAPAPGTSTRAPLDDSVRTLLPVLKAQPGGHYITVHIQGRPYLVMAGDCVRLPFLMAGVVPGDVLRLNRASTLGSRDLTLVGAPFVDERLFECRAVVTGVESEPMRIMIKKKRRCRRKKRVRSKHRYTMLRIREVRICDLDETV